MSNKLELLRARLKEAQTKSDYNNNNKGESPYYKHWETREEPGNYTSVRFLPDGNPDSSFFWVEKDIIKMPFAGVKGKSTAPIKVNVPCMQMYGETCPILEETKPLWKTDEDTARLYYKKRSYLLHGFVRKDGVGETTKPENPIRRFNMTSDIFKIIQAGLMDPDMENIPTDYMQGTDFNIYKLPGKWPDYGTSKWARKSGPLTEEEALAIERYGLPDLTTYLPKKPSKEELAIIMDMFVDSMNGEAYDIDKYGAYFKPFGLDSDESATPQRGSGNFNTSTSSSKSEEVDTTPTSVVQKATESVTPVSGDKSKTSVQDLLAQIQKNKNKA